MTTEQWQPGDPVYRRWMDDTYSQSMISFKREQHDEELNSEAARWTPELGWCYDDDD